VIVRFTPCGSTHIFSLPRIANPTGSIVLDPDGNLWFPAAYAIVRMTPEGHLTVFTISRPDNLQIQAIIVGPDGNLWFAEFFAGKIARVTMDGRVTEFSLLGSGDVPNGTLTIGTVTSLVRGKNRRLLFVATNGFGTISMDGHLVTYFYSHKVVYAG